MKIKKGKKVEECVKDERVIWERCSPELDNIDWCKQSPKEGLKGGSWRGPHPSTVWQLHSQKKNRRCIQNTTICQPWCFTFLPLITPEAQTLIKLLIFSLTIIIISTSSPSFGNKTSALLNTLPYTFPHNY